MNGWESRCSKSVSLVSSWRWIFHDLTCLKWDTVARPLCREFQQWHLTEAAVTVLTGPPSGFTAFCFQWIIVSTLLVFTYAQQSTSQFVHLWIKRFLKKHASDCAELSEKFMGLSYGSRCHIRNLESQGVLGLCPLEIVVSCERCSHSTCQPQRQWCTGDLCVFSTGRVTGIFFYFFVRQAALTFMPF